MLFVIIEKSSEQSYSIVHYKLKNNNLTIDETKTTD